MKKDLISIIVPVYNVEQYLKRCIDSIIKQTYENIEIILVDDGSPDHSGEICDEYKKKDERIKVLHKENGGLSDARNQGIRMAKGKYIGFVDSDDWIHEKMFETLYEVLIEKNADISSCKMIRCTNEIGNVGKKFDHKITEYNQIDYLKKFFKIGTQESMYYACNKLYRKELLEEEQYPINLTSEDVVGTYKVLLKCEKIVEINYPYYYYFYNSNGITASGFSKRDFDLIQIWDQVIQITKNENKSYLWMAELNRYRIDYTLLMRMALELEFYQIKDLYYEEYKKMLQSLKMHKRILLKSQIPFSRKLTIILICWNYKIFTKIVKIKSWRNHK